MKLLTSLILALSLALTATAANKPEPTIMKMSEQQPIYSMTEFFQEQNSKNNFASTLLVANSTWQVLAPPNAQYSTCVSSHKECETGISNPWVRVWDILEGQKCCFGTEEQYVYVADPKPGRNFEEQVSWRRKIDGTVKHVACGNFCDETAGIYYLSVYGPEAWADKPDFIKYLYPKA